MYEVRSKIKRKKTQFYFEIFLNMVVGASDGSWHIEVIVYQKYILPT